MAKNSGLKVGALAAFVVLICAAVPAAATGPMPASMALIATPLGERALPGHFDHRHAYRRRHHWFCQLRDPVTAGVYDGINLPQLRRPCVRGWER